MVDRENKEREHGQEVVGVCAGKMEKLGTEKETYTHESRCGVEIGREGFVFG